MIFYIQCGYAMAEWAADLRALLALLNLRHTPGRKRMPIFCAKESGWIPPRPYKPG